MEQAGASSEQGNTKSSSRGYQTFNWCLTWNNYPEDWENQLLSYIGARAAYVFGREVGESGTRHIQGVIKFPAKKRLETLHAAFPTIHWEKCKSWKASIKYCSKDGNYIERGSKLPKPLLDPLQGKTLYPWQREIVAIIERPPDDRTIHWYWDADGCTGKTSLAKSICLRDKMAITLSGKAQDIKYGIASFIESNGGCNLAIFHFTRSIENFVSYEALESIKDGMFFSGKYESKMVLFNTPHVFVFANFKPDESKMSRDRWRVINIKKDGAVVAAREEPPIMDPPI